MYAIPKGDNHTIIPLHQTALFFCEGHANRGTFYTNFKLDTLKENYIALYDGDGKNLIDSVTIPAGQKADVTFGRLADGVTPWGFLKVATPNSNNVTNDKNEKVENFKERDGYGIAMTYHIHGDRILGTGSAVPLLQSSRQCLYQGKQT
jgi:hypothetical protein